MAVKLIPEVLALCSAGKSPEQIVQVLRSNSSPALQELLKYAYWPGVEFDTPIPEWNREPNPIGLSPNSLFTEARRLYLFTKAKDLPQQKKVELLLNILESVHPSEAFLVVDLIKNRSLPFECKQVTETIVREAFPKLLPPL